MTEHNIKKRLSVNVSDTCTKQVFSVAGQGYKICHRFWLWSWSRAVETHFKKPKFLGFF